MILDTNNPKVNDIFWINNGDSRSPITDCLFLSAEKNYAEQGFKIWEPDTVFLDDELLP